MAFINQVVGRTLSLNNAYINGGLFLENLHSSNPKTASSFRFAALRNTRSKNRMARSISNAKIVLEKLSLSASTRGYTTAAAEQGAVSGGGVGINAMLKKGGDESGKTVTAWIPDPVTGYYRPESHVQEVDAAELRQMLLKNVTTSH